MTQGVRIGEVLSYPISPKRHTFEYLREVPDVHVRANAIGVVARLRNTSTVTGSAAEGAGEMSASRRSTWPTCRKHRTAVDFSPGGTEF